MSFFQKGLRCLLRAAVAVFGARVTDFQTGRSLGKALFIPWRGRLHVIGLQEARAAAQFLPQRRLTYWRQTIGFTTHPEPDFPHQSDERDPIGHSDPPA